MACSVSSACSVCACRVATCSVGIRTKVWGNGVVAVAPSVVPCSVSSLLGLGMFAVINGRRSQWPNLPSRLPFQRARVLIERTQRYKRRMRRVANVPEAMFIARSTLCQLPMTVAIAARIQLSVSPSSFSKFRDCPCSWTTE